MVLPNLNQLLMDDEVQMLFAGGWARYRKSPALQDITWDAHAVCATINRIFYDDQAEAQRLFHELVPGAGVDIDFRAPFTIDYGTRLTIGDRTFINTDFLVVGAGLVTIGEDCLIGPRCSIYTPNHAPDITRRLEGYEQAKPVVIGDNVWLGGSVTITQGVTIGDNSIIGAGSVVTRDIPAGVVAVGNPCRVIKPIPETFTSGV